MMHVRPILVVEDSDEDYQTVVDGALRCAVANSIHRVTSGGTYMDYLRRQLGKQQESPAWPFKMASAP